MTFCRRPRGLNQTWNGTPLDTEQNAQLAVVDTYPEAGVPLANYPVSSAHPGDYYVRVI